MHAIYFNMHKLSTACVKYYAGSYCGAKNHSFILSISVKLTPETSKIAFKDKYSSFNSAYVSTAFSFFANCMYV